jgi:hypothetical protein
MPTERVTLDLDRTALYLARAAADAAHLSLSDWLSVVARERGMQVAAEMSAANERLHPDEPVGWADEVADRVFGAGDE